MEILTKDRKENNRQTGFGRLLFSLVIQETEDFFFYLFHGHVGVLTITMGAQVGDGHDGLGHGGHEPDAKLLLTGYCHHPADFFRLYPLQCHPSTRGHRNLNPIFFREFYEVLYLAFATPLAFAKVKGNLLRTF